MKTAKDAYREELEGLLTVWHALALNPQATEKDYSRCSKRIQEVCAALDEIERLEAVR